MSPTLFMVANAIVTVALLCHLAIVYGRARAARIALVVVGLAVLKELTAGGTEYIVTLPGRQGAFHPGVAAGWLVTVLLGLDFSRRVSLDALPEVADRLFPRCLLAALFGWQMSNAVEPIGQLAGWWHWTPAFGSVFPHLEPGRWAHNTYLFGGAALVAAGCAPRRVPAAVLVLLVPFAVGGFLEPNGLAAALPAALLAYWVGGPQLDPMLTPPLRRDGALRWVERIPALSTALILATLAIYGALSPAPAAVGYLGGTALLACLPWLLRIGGRGVAHRIPRGARLGGALVAALLAVACSGSWWVKPPEGTLAWDALHATAERTGRAQPHRLSEAPPVATAAVGPP